MSSSQNKNCSEDRLNYKSIFRSTKRRQIYIETKTTGSFKNTLDYPVEICTNSGLYPPHCIQTKQAGLDPSLRKCFDFAQYDRIRLNLRLALHCHLRKKAVCRAEMRESERIVFEMALIRNRKNSLFHRLPLDVFLLLCDDILSDQSVPRREQKHYKLIICCETGNHLSLAIANELVESGDLLGLSSVFPYKIIGDWESPENNRGPGVNSKKAKKKAAKAFNSKAKLPKGQRQKGRDQKMNMF